MPLEPTEVELSVERELPDGRRLRVAARFRAVAGPPTEAELREATERLGRELEAAAAPLLGPTAAPAPERSLEELLEAYRPRQPELVDLLRAEGEITPAEHELLRRHLASGRTEPAPRAPPSRPPALAAEPPLTDRPLAAMPLANDRTPSVPRPVEELLDTYRITNLKQAGAVRARRQISFEEYMALKRHFAAAEVGGAPPRA